MSSWKECLEENKARRVTIDRAKAKALIETAKERLKFLKNDTSKDSNPNFLFEGCYTSLTELLHALVLTEGWKVENHVCLGNYLRDISKREDLFRAFDDCRYKRNGLVYYGKNMDFEVARDSVKKAAKLIEELQRLLMEKHVVGD